MKGELRVLTLEFYLDVNDIDIWKGKRFVGKYSGENIVSIVPVVSAIYRGIKPVEFV